MCDWSECAYWLTSGVPSLTVAQPFHRSRLVAVLDSIGLIPVCEATVLHMLDWARASAVSVLCVILGVHEHVHVV